MARIICLSKLNGERENYMRWDGSDPYRFKFSSPLNIVQTVTRAHTAFYPMGNMSELGADKADGTLEAGHSPPSSTE